MADVIELLFGVAVGATVTALWQRYNARDAQLHAQLERLRQDRMAVYGEFAAAVIEFRRAQLDRWHNPDDQGRLAEARRTRSVVWQQFYRVQLVADDPDLVDKAEVARDLATELKNARGEEQLDADADRVRVLVDQYIAAARDQVMVRPAP